LLRLENGDSHVSQSAEAPHLLAMELVGQRVVGCEVGHLGGGILGSALCSGLSIDLAINNMYYIKGKKNPEIENLSKGQG
jgi:hypothetical protein